MTRKIQGRAYRLVDDADGTIATFTVWHPRASSPITVATPGSRVFTLNIEQAARWLLGAHRQFGNVRRNPERDVVR
jgi:hypothetical protein